MRAQPAIFLMLLCLSAACKGSSTDAASKEDRAAAPGSAKPLEVDWVKEDKFQVKGSPKQYGEVAIFQSIYQVTVHGFPEGTKWAALDKKGIIDSDVYNILKILDMTEKFGDVPVDKNKQREVRLDPGANLTLELPSGEKADIKLPGSDLGLSIDEMLKKVENGPVLFGKEPPDDKPMENILFLEGLTPEVFGRASVLKDVDAVAKAATLPGSKGTKTCTGYKDNAGKPAADIELQLKEAEVVIYERRTGNVVQKKVFPPDDTCPMFTFRRADEKVQDSSIPTTAIKEWLRTQVKR